MQATAPSPTIKQSQQALTTQTKQSPSLLSRSLNGCFSLIKGAARCAGKVLGGSAAGIVTGHINGGIILAARKMHILSSSQEFMESSCPTPLSEGLFNPTCAANATLISQGATSCRSVIKSMEKLFSDRLSQRLNQTVSVELSNGGIINFIGVIPAVVEEIAMRGIIQDVLLQRLPSYLVKKVLPGKETLLQSKTYTVARVVFTSLLFAAIHLTNQGILSNEYIQAQIITQFAIGIIFGAVKESRLGLLGSMSAHFVQNMMAMAPCLSGQI